ncbi:MAG: hypothetical protein Q8Q67_01375 [bacterium]|nr:hypothetical protein [bacterium]
MKIVIPTTGLIEIQSNEGQWHLLQKGLANEITTAAVITISDERRIKVNVVLDEAFLVKSTTDKKFSVINSADSKIEACIYSNFNFVMNTAMKDYWYFRAIIKGTTPVPILIQYFPVIKTAVYTKVSSQEVPSMNFPNHMSN